MNISQIKSYKKWLSGQLIIQPSLVNIIKNHKEIHEVDYIIDSRLKGKRLEYLAHWIGCLNKDHTWKPLDHLDGAKDTIHKFHILHLNTSC